MNLRQRNVVTDAGIQLMKIVTSVNIQPLHQKGFHFFLKQTISKVKVNKTFRRTLRKTWRKSSFFEAYSVYGTS